MKRQIVVLLCAALAAPVMFCACRTVEKNPPPPAAENTLDRKAFIRFGDTVLRSIQREDYATFATLSESGKQNPITTADFEKSCRAMRQHYGRIKEFSFLTQLKSPIADSLVWRVTFEKENAQKQMLEQQLLCQIVLGEVNRKIEMLGFRFL